MGFNKIIILSLAFISLPILVSAGLFQDIEENQEAKEMVFTKLTPNLMVEDVNSTIEFYKDVLGFELLLSIPEEGTFDFALMKSGNVEIMFQARESLAKDFPPEFKNKKAYEVLTLYIDMEHIEELLKKMLRIH